LLEPCVAGLELRRFGIARHFFPKKAGVEVPVTDVEKNKIQKNDLTVKKE
jgi:hypothetical protein